jgi:hypothetical protein
MPQPFDPLCLNESILTISAPSIDSSISMLFRILYILSILTGPNIFLNICLSKMRRLLSSFAVKVQVSDACVTTGFGGNIRCHIPSLSAFVHFECRKTQECKILLVFNFSRFLGCTAKHKYQVRAWERY